MANNNDFTEEDFEDDLQKEDFDWWWDEEGGILLTHGDNQQKDIAQAAWLAAWRFYTGGGL